jgi:hypothetical protein
MRAVESTIIGALDEHGRHDGHWSETPADLVERNIRLLAKTAKAFDGMRPI